MHHTRDHSRLIRHPNSFVSSKRYSLSLRSVHSSWRPLSVLHSGIFAAVKVRSAFHQRSKSCVCGSRLLPRECAVLCCAVLQGSVVCGLLRSVFVSRDRERTVWSQIYSQHSFVLSFIPSFTYSSTLSLVLSLSRCLWSVLRGVFGLSLQLSCFPSL